MNEVDGRRVGKKRRITRTRSVVKGARVVKVEDLEMAINPAVTRDKVEDQWVKKFQMGYT